MPLPFLAGLRIVDLGQYLPAPMRHSFSVTWAPQW